MTNSFYTFKSFTSLSEEEITLVWEWRNHIEIRQWMYNDNIIPWEDHIRFVQNLEQNSTKKYWLVQRRNKNVGVMSIIDIKENEGEWGYYIAPHLHEMNFGVEFYYYSLQYLFEEEKMSKLYGYALVKNKGANSLNDLFGFDKIQTTKIIGDDQLELYYRILDKDNWLKKTKDDKKILQLLNFTKEK